MLLAHLCGFLPDMFAELNQALEIAPRVGELLRIDRARIRDHGIRDETSDLLAHSDQSVFHLHIVELVCFLDDRRFGW